MRGEVPVHMGYEQPGMEAIQFVIHRNTLFLSPRIPQGGLCSWCISNPGGCNVRRMTAATEIEGGMMTVKLGFSDNEVRLLIDVLKGEEQRLHTIRQEDADLAGPDWFQRRVDEVGALKDRLKAVRV